MFGQRKHCLQRCRRDMAQEPQEMKRTGVCKDKRSGCRQEWGPVSHRKERGLSWKGGGKLAVGLVEEQAILEEPGKAS